MSDIAYYRVSTGGQTIDAQRTALAGPFEREFVDHGISGAVLAHKRPGFAELLRYVREGDTLHVFAIDRLGRDALDVQSTVRLLMEKGVVLDVRGLGRIAHGVGTLIVAVVAQIAEMERAAIAERTGAGLATAKASLAATGLTHRGKTSLGRPHKQDPAAVHAWRNAQGASVTQTARHFGINPSTVKRYSASEIAAAKRSNGQDSGGNRDDAVGRAVPVPTGTIDRDITVANDAGDTIAVNLALAPVPVGTGENGGNGVVFAPAHDDVAEPLFCEINMPLPFDLSDPASAAPGESRAEVGKQPVAVGGGNIKPGRPVTEKRRSGDGGRIRKSRDGMHPVGSVGSVDDEPMLPFDDPQGGFGEKRGG